MDKGYVNAICTLNMTKGFDTVSHDSLIHKLSFYGFSVASCNFLPLIYLNAFSRLKAFDLSDGSFSARKYSNRMIRAACCGGHLSILNMFRVSIKMIANGTTM